MKTILKWLFCALLITYVAIIARDIFIPEVITETVVVPDPTFETEYGRTTYCYKTNDNFLICKLGD